MKITIIGAGNIGGAIARGLAKGHMFKASDITCTAQTDTTLEKMRNTNPMIHAVKADKRPYTYPLQLRKLQ